ncbi:maleylpyruvate isomerase N-terminal domain-containing protein [Streptomyces nigrescens]
MIDLKPACRQIIDVLAGVGDEQLTKPTPCTEYTVGDLIVHVGEAAQGFTMIARKDSSEGGDTEPAAEPATVSPSDQWQTASPRRCGRSGRHGMTQRPGMTGQARRALN